MGSQFYFLLEEHDKKYAEIQNRNKNFERTFCEKCGRINNIIFNKGLELEVVGRKKANYYKFLANDFRFYVDEKLEKVLLENNISGFTLKEINKYNDGANGLKEMVIEGRAGFLKNKNGVEFEKCELCNRIMNIYATLSKETGTMICEEDWNGEDIFLIENYTSFPVVTQKVKELFEKNKIKNAKFVPIEEYKWG